MQLTWKVYLHCTLYTSLLPSTGVLISLSFVFTKRVFRLYKQRFRGATAPIPNAGNEGQQWVKGKPGNNIYDIYLLVIRSGYQLVCIENRTDASAIRDLWARVMFWKFSKLYEPLSDCNVRTFKASWVTINCKLHELLSTDANVFVFFNFWVHFSFIFPFLPDIHSRFGSSHCIFVYRFFFKLFNKIMVLKSNV